MKASWKKSVKKLELLFPYLNEKQKRLLAAAEAEQLGEGAQSYLSVQLGIHRSVIKNGLKELHSETPEEEKERVRKAGGGRKSLEENQPGLMTTLQFIVEPGTRGDPETPLKWTSKSVTKIAIELAEWGYKISPSSVCDLLKKMGYSLQANKKVKEGDEHPDRDKQFEHINSEVKAALEQGQPVISVDTKKRELIGDVKNPGRRWEVKGHPTEVMSHDFKREGMSVAIPYGIYDVKNNNGFVNVGIDHDTAVFSVQSIRTWWNTLGKQAYPTAKKILVCADCGGSNGYRNRLWKRELQTFSSEVGLDIQVCHLPPGTSKWNKIEHRLFSEISKNWRGHPLESLETIIKLISSTTTQTGLKVETNLDENKYPTGIKVSKKEVLKLRINKHEFHGEWNYTMQPAKLN
jgi:transposase